ncbi:MAG: hypothetical protein IKW86_06910 [Salinivirgaceae bacterium]|nr:hypothetical protein [Salinivirgaceae bacterium]
MKKAPFVLLICVCCFGCIQTNNKQSESQITDTTITDSIHVNKEPAVQADSSFENNDVLNSIECVNDDVKDYVARKCNHYTKEGIHPYCIQCNGMVSVYDKSRSFGEGKILDSVDVIFNYNNDVEYVVCQTTAKLIHVSFSKSKPLMIINYLDDRPEYYDAILDDYFWIYNLDSLANGALHKDSIYCKYCDDGYVIGDKLFFTRSNEQDDFQGGYWLTDIYVSPFDNIADSVVVARNFGIRAISSDGKYIIAENKNTISQYSCAIIDVEQKKYQVLLGRNYCNRTVIYSDEEQKFGFIFGKKIVYVDMPKTFPFDALEKKDIFWPRPKGLEEKFEKPSLQ